MFEQIVKVVGLVTGIYGAMLSTALAISKWRSEVPRLRVQPDLSRMRVRFDAGWSLEYRTEDEESENPWFISVKVTNVGKVVVVVDKIILAFSTGEMAAARYDAVPLPRKLDSGDYFNYAINLRLSEADRNLKHIEVVSTTNRHWRAPRRAMRRLRSIAAIAHSEGLKEAGSE